MPGVCVEQMGPMLTLKVEVFKIVHGVKVPYPTQSLKCNIDEVVECQEEEMEPKLFKNWGSLSVAEMRFIVKACWGNEQGYAVNVEEGRMLHDCDLVAIFEYLQWQYMLHAVRFVKSGIVKIAMHFPTQEHGMMCLQEIRDLMEAARFVVLPVHSDAGPHWTFLVLEVEEDSSKIMHVTYYDWGRGCVKESAVLAQMLLSNITLSGDDEVSEPMKLPKPCNWYRQAFGSNDCGLAAWQALENCFKICRMEGRCGVLPEPKQWRKTLKIFLNKLIGVQEKWQMEEAQAKKPKHPVCLPGVKKVGAEAVGLKMTIKDFFGAGCPSCRWTTTGDGCCYCNPEKHDKLRGEKQLRASAMAENLKKALQKCQDLGLVTIPAVPAPKDAAGPDKGGAGAVL